MRDPSDVATRRARHWPEARQVLSHPDFHHGFREAQSGRPFDHRRADALPRLGQIRYENGRQIAAECAALGLAVDWPSPGHIPPALKHLVLRRLARKPKNAYIMGHERGARKSGSDLSAQNRSASGAHGRDAG